MYRVYRREGRRFVPVSRQAECMGAVVTALVGEGWKGPVVVVDVKGNRTSWEKLGGGARGEYSGLCRGLAESAMADGRCEIEVEDGRVYEVREESDEG